MTNQLALCAYQNDVNKPKYERLCNELTILQERAIPPSLQKLIAGYAVEVTCMSCRQVKKQGAPALEIAMTFFKENRLRQCLQVSTRYFTEFPDLLPTDIIIPPESAVAKFDLFIVNSWRYSLFNLYAERYGTVAAANPKPPEAYEGRICFHLLTAQHHRSLLHPVFLEMPLELQNAMQQERDAVTKELVNVP